MANSLISAVQYLTGLKWSNSYLSIYHEFYKMNSKYKVRLYSDLDNAELLFWVKI